MRGLRLAGLMFAGLLTIASPGYAQFGLLADCSALGSLTHAQLTTALQGVVAQSNGGFGLNMWATIINRRGEVCMVARSGAPTDQWPGSRVISAQKANTANAFSLPNLALSTANLYTAVQPGGSLFGLQESNPVNPAVAYAGNSTAYGTASDPMVSFKIGGVNVFGGGLALYDANGILIGGIGVSGDTSCADHAIAWKLRHVLGLDHVPGGVSGDPARPDNIVYDITQPGKSVAHEPASTSGWGHPHCLPSDVAPSSLPAVP